MSHVNRREFLGTMAAAGYAASSLAQASENEWIIKIGLIGCGWYGNVDLEAALAVGGVDVTALCDVDSKHLNDTADKIAKKQGKRPATFKDYRDMLDAPGLGAVFIATPPHWHALPFIAACEKGLDVYCEKPLAYDVREGRAMVDSARRHKRIVQIGFQRRQSDSIKAATEYLGSGKPGKLVQVDARIHYSAGRKSRKPEDPPPTLDWDTWCGPAPKLAYCPAVGHIHWRLEKTTGHGHLVDWGIHLIDAVRTMLGESMPKTIWAGGGLYNLGDHITTPDTLSVHFEFKTCPVVWRHRIWGSAEYRPEVNNGIFFYCEKETVFVSDTKWMIIPKGKGKEPKEMNTEQRGEMQKLHVGDFLTAVRTRKLPTVVPEDGYRSTATVQLAMIAYETGSKVVWDERRDQIVDNPEAAKLLKREYRPPWKHPYSSV